MKFRSAALGAFLLVVPPLLALVLCGVITYPQLFQWDGDWYRKIVDIGYVADMATHRESQANLGFFPGYPIATLLLQKLLPLKTEIALILTAQLAAIGFWIYWLLFLRNILKLSPETTFLVSAFYLAQPGEFFLVASYSESLFLFAMMGFLYWQVREPQTKTTFFLALLHGALMSATRLVAVAILLFPLLLFLFTRRKPLRALALSAGSTLGLFAFLAFCQMKFGDWKIYWKVLAMGWNVTSDWFAPLRWSLYARANLTGFRPDAMGRLLTVVTIVTSLVGTFFAIKTRSWKSHPKASAMVLVAGGLLFITLVGRSTLQFNGLVRYLLPVHALLFPALGLWIDAHVQKELATRRYRWVVSLLFLSLFLYAFQIGFAARFARAEWVG